MGKYKRYRIPDVLEMIYQDVFWGLYSTTDYKKIKNRIKIGKCNLACDMLINTDKSIENISSELDFPDVESFKYCFNDFLSIFPEEFRKRFHY